MTGRREPDGKIRAYNEVKGVALNLKRSPEKQVFRVRADPIRSGAGQAEGTPETSANRPPGVSDGIELYNGWSATRRATSKGSWGKSARQYPSMGGNVKRADQKAASRVMRTCTPQRLALRRGNALGAKVLTFGQPSR